MDYWALIKIIKNIIGILDGNDLLTETEDIVNKFADFFSTIGQNGFSTTQDGLLTPIPHKPKPK